MCRHVDACASLHRHHPQRAHGRRQRFKHMSRGLDVTTVSLLSLYPWKWRNKRFLSNSVVVSFRLYYSVFYFLIILHAALWRSSCGSVCSLPPKHTFSCHSLVRTCFWGLKIFSMRFYHDSMFSSWSFKCRPGSVVFAWGSFQLFKKTFKWSPRYLTWVGRECIRAGSWNRCPTNQHARCFIALIRWNQLVICLPYDCQLVGCLPSCGRGRTSVCAVLSSGW